MTSVFDQLSWTFETSSERILQLVSTQLNEQEKLRLQIRKQLIKDYPPTAISWMDTCTWSPPTLVPLSSFDLRGVEKWPTWQDTKKIKAFTEKIESGWHKPIVAVKVPGSRYLNAIDGHTRLSVYWKLHRPVFAWVGKTPSVSGPWDTFHQKQRGMTSEQKDTSFANQLLIDGSIAEPQYQLLLTARREARLVHLPGHPERVAAERSVRQARKLRRSCEAKTELVLAETEPDRSHTELLAARRVAQEKYPPGHPDRVVAERNVRKSRSVR